MSQNILIDNIKVGWLHGLFITYLKKFEQTLHRLTNIIMKKLVEIVTIVATFALSCSSDEMRGMSNKQYLALSDCSIQRLLWQQYDILCTWYPWERMATCHSLAKQNGQESKQEEFLGPHALCNCVWMYSIGELCVNMRKAFNAPLSCDVHFISVRSAKLDIPPWTGCGGWCAKVVIIRNGEIDCSSRNTPANWR